MYNEFDKEITEKLQEFFEVEERAKGLKQEAEEAYKYAGQLKMEIKDMMEEIGVKSCEAGSHTLTVKKNPVSVVIVGNVPLKYCKEKQEPDKTAIKKYLESNQCEWAKFSDPSTTLQIKHK